VLTYSASGAKERESAQLAWVAGSLVDVRGGELKVKAMLRAKNGKKRTREKPPTLMH